MQGTDISATLRERYFGEEKELFGEKPDATTEEDYLPRQSGSLEWRSDRGEIGIGKGVMDSTAGSATIKTRDEMNQLMKDMQQEALSMQREEAKQ